MSLDPPDRWKLHSGPTNWYRLWHPPEWVLTQDDDVTLLSAPDGQSTLVLQAAWIAEPDQSPLLDLLPPNGLFSRMRAVRTAAAIPRNFESIGQEGEVLLEQPPPWWKRPFAVDNWRRWRLWAFRRGPIVVVGRLLRGAAPDQEMESLAAMMLRTLQFASPPADPPQIFADRVLALARSKFPLLDCKAGEGFQLKLGESDVNLFNFYRSYVKAPEKFEQIMLPALTTVVQIHEWGSEQSSPPLDRVRTRIMPMLYPESVWQERFPNFVGQAWVAGLAVLYVVDESHAYWYVRHDLATRWELGLEELHAIALANLDAYFERKLMEMAVAGTAAEEASLVMPSQPDSYNGVRLLSEQFRHRMQEILGPAFAVGIPSRDFFVAVSLESEEMLAHVRQRVREDHRQSDHPLSEQLLLVSPDGVSAFEDRESVEG